jgi:hypothetical protein
MAVLVDQAVQAAQAVLEDRAELVALAVSAEAEAAVAADIMPLVKASETKLAAEAVVEQVLLLARAQRLVDQMAQQQLVVQVVRADPQLVMVVQVAHSRQLVRQAAHQQLQAGQVVVLVHRVQLDLQEQQDSLEQADQAGLQELLAQLSAATTMLHFG